MNSQILTPKHANPPGVGGSPRDGRHPNRPPATESTLKQIGTEPICFPGGPKSDLGSNTKVLAVLGPKRTTVRAPKTHLDADKNPIADGFTQVSTERGPLPCCLAESVAGLESNESPSWTWLTGWPTTKVRDARARVRRAALTGRVVLS